MLVSEIDFIDLASMIQVFNILPVKTWIEMSYFACYCYAYFSKNFSDILQQCRDASTVSRVE